MKVELENMEKQRRNYLDNPREIIKLERREMKQSEKLERTSEEKNQNLRTTKKQNKNVKFLFLI